MNEWKLAKYIPETLFLPYARSTVEATENEFNESFFISTKGMFQKDLFLFPNYAKSTTDIEAHRMYTMLVHGVLGLRGAQEVRCLGDETRHEGILSIDSLLDISSTFTLSRQIGTSQLYRVNAKIRGDNGASVEYKSLFETNLPLFEDPEVIYQADNGLHRMFTNSNPQSTHKRVHEICKEWRTPRSYLQPQLFKSAKLMLENAMQSWNADYNSVLGLNTEVNNYFVEGDTITPTIKLRLIEETQTQVLFDFEYLAHKYIDPKKTRVKGLAIGTKRDNFDFNTEKKEKKTTKFKQPKKEDGFLPPTNSFKPPSTKWKGFKK